ncbi:hypothetical protein ACF073_12505 [Streptomyces sp. NPDC015171]|uniref:hypothetical protein n=1 Tax=Streptomyces sp. NPDC015171 TaxID=3364945 RepID=UPI0036F54808
MRRRPAAPVLGTLLVAAVVGVACMTAQPRQVRAAAPGTRSASPSAAPSASPSVPSSASPSSVPPSCGSGALRWGAVRQRTQLTGLSPVVALGEDDGWTTFRDVPVRSVVARVRTSGTHLAQRRVLASLARHLGYDTDDLTAPGEDTARHARPPERTRFHGAGRFATAEAVRTVDASFTVTCPDGDHYGSVTTWLGPVHGDSLACGTDPGKEPWLREAYRLACGPLTGR